MLFITHQLPKGLAVDEAILLGKDAATENQANMQANTSNNQSNMQLNTNADEKVET